LQFRIGHLAGLRCEKDNDSQQIGWIAPITFQNTSRMSTFDKQQLSKLDSDNTAYLYSLGLRLCHEPRWWKLCYTVTRSMDGWTSAKFPFDRPLRPYSTAWCIFPGM